MFSCVAAMYWRTCVETLYMLKCDSWKTFVWLFDLSCDRMAFTLIFSALGVRLENHFLSCQRALNEIDFSIDNQITLRIRVRDNEVIMKLIGRVHDMPRQKGYPIKGLYDRINYNGCQTSNKLLNLSLNWRLCAARRRLSAAFMKLLTCSLKTILHASDEWTNTSPAITNSANFKW